MTTTSPRISAASHHGTRFRLRSHGVAVPVSMPRLRSQPEAPSSQSHPSARPPLSDSQPLTAFQPNQGAAPSTAGMTSHASLRRAAGLSIRAQPPAATAIGASSGVVHQPRPATSPNTTRSAVAVPS